MAPALYGIAARNTLTGQLMRFDTAARLRDVPDLVAEYEAAFAGRPDVVVELDTAPAG